MKLDRAYHAVISGGHLCPLVTAIMKGIVPLDGHLTDDPLSQVLNEMVFLIVCHAFTVVYRAAGAGFPARQFPFQGYYLLQFDHMPCNSKSNLIT